MFQSNQLAQDERNKGTTFPLGSLIHKKYFILMATDGVYILKGKMDLHLYISVCVSVCMHTYIYVYTCV